MKYVKKGKSKVHLQRNKGNLVDSNVQVIFCTRVTRAKGEPREDSLRVNTKDSKLWFMCAQPRSVLGFKLLAECKMPSWRANSILESRTMFSGRYIRSISSLKDLYETPSAAYTATRNRTML